MPLLYTEDHRAIAAGARRVLGAIMDTAALLPLVDGAGRYHEDWWDLVRAQGWTATALPETHEGLGLGLVELGVIVFEMGRELTGAPFLTSSYGVARALIRHGGVAADEWLPRLAGGEAIGVVAFAERQDVLGMGVTFAAGRLNGVKAGVPGGIHGDVALVLASDGGEPTLALAPLEGVRCTASAGFDNSRCTAALHFDATPAIVLVRGEAALDAARDVLAAQAVVTAHEQAGGAQALLERACNYALERRAFGQPIGAFQSIKHRIAELYVVVELARAVALSAAASDGSDDFLTAAAAARLQAGEAYDTCARDVTHIHGAMGVTWESGIHLHVRRARSLGLEQGNSLFWEDLLVGQLVKAQAKA